MTSHTHPGPDASHKPPTPPEDGNEADATFLTDLELAQAARRNVEALLTLGVLPHTYAAGLAHHVYALEALERRIPAPPTPTATELAALELTARELTLLTAAIATVLDAARDLAPGSLSGERLAPFRDALENLATTTGHR